MLSAKENAKELVEKYYHLFSVELENTISYYEAKHCALIAQKNLIQKLKELNIEDSFEEEVKTEIQKLC